MPDQIAIQFFFIGNHQKTIEVVATIYTPLEGHKIYSSSRQLVLSGLLIFANLMGLK